MTTKLQVSVQAAGELACRPGSVRPLARAGGHPSRAAVAGNLVRSTRELGRAALSRSRRSRCSRIPSRARDSLLTLLRVGFTEPPRSPWALVVSYTTVSPLPPVSRGRSVFCGTFPRVTPGRRYRPPCPAEPEPSSARQADLARRDRPASSPAARVQRRGRTATLATGRNLPGISRTIISCFPHCGRLGLPERP